VPKMPVGLSGMMFPNPVVLLSVGHGDEANIITVSWAGTACGNPWMVTVSVRPATHSHGLIFKYREFVVNVPTLQIMKAVEICGSRSGRDVNKWKEANLHPDESISIRTPGIAECPISIECRVRHTLDLGLHTLFVGEVFGTRRDMDWVFDPTIPLYVEGKYYSMNPQLLQ